MGMALDTVSGGVTNPGGTLTAWTLASGDSLTVRNAIPNSAIWLIDLWHFVNAAGAIRVRSPKLHDNVQGIRFQVTTTNFPLLPPRYPQRLFSQDALIVESSGGGAAQTDVGSLLVWYENIDGVAAKLVNADFVRQRGINDVGVRVSVVTATGPNYSGQVALNSTDDLLVANTDYALIGYVLDTQIGTIAIRGADTGNLRVSGPGNISMRWLTAEWFYRLSRDTGLPCIPVFNSANKAGIFIDAVQTQAAGTVICNLIFVQLAPGAVTAAPAR